MMHIESCVIEDVKMLFPKKYGDHRGFFSETYSKKKLYDVGIDAEFVQDNHSYSERKGTVRGLHFQATPFSQHKLLRVVRGAVYDVAVDIRKGSRTYGSYVAVTLTAEEGNQIFIPRGFAHGFMTLEDDTEVLYKVSAYYSLAHERGLRWNDPCLAIPWPCLEKEVIITERDATFPLLETLDA